MFELSVLCVCGRVSVYVFSCCRRYPRLYVDGSFREYEFSKTEVNVTKSVQMVQYHVLDITSV